MSKNKVRYNYKSLNPLLHIHPLERIIFSYIFLNGFLTITFFSIVNSEEFHYKEYYLIIIKNKLKIQ